MFVDNDVVEGFKSFFSNKDSVVKFIIELQNAKLLVETKPLS